MSDDQHKSEQASPYKLKEAKDKGQVSKSTEVTSVLMLVAGGAVFVAMSGSMIDSIKELFAALLANAGNQEITIGNIKALTFLVIGEVVSVMAPMALVLVLGAIFFNILQTGPVLSSHPLTPDVKRLNPVEGFKKIISLKSLFDLVKTLVKLSVIVGVWFALGSDWLGLILESYGMSPTSFTEHWQGLVAKLLLLALLVLGPLALIDFAFTNWQFAKKMMMSKQEVKDEHKKREGDPLVKQKQKQIQKELLQKAASLSSVKDADVVITNPEHIAVALKYETKTMLAPKVLAMGADNNAATIRKIARTHKVPIVRNIPLARKLYKQCSVNGYIPESSFADVAPIFRKLWKLDNGVQTS